jgi:hypothetical protein
MQGRKYTIVIAALVAAAIAFPASAVAERSTSPAAPNSVTFTNSGGADAAAPQISSVVVSNDSTGTLTYQVNIANRPELTDAMEIGLALDTDQNPATGQQDAAGADYMIFVDSSGVGLIHWNGSGFDLKAPQSSLSYVYTPSGATIKVNAADLGGTRGFNFFVRAFSGIAVDSSGNPDFSNAHHDDAPRQGTWGYQLKAQALQLSVLTFQTQPSRPSAGHPLVAMLAVGRNDGAQLTDAQVTCTATIGGKPLAARTHAVANGVALCAWSIPKAARGKRLHGSVTVSSGGLQATRSFSANVA